MKLNSLFIKLKKIYLRILHLILRSILRLVMFLDLKILTYLTNKILKHDLGTFIDYTSAKNNFPSIFKIISESVKMFTYTEPVFFDSKKKLGNINKSYQNKLRTSCFKVFDARITGNSNIILFKDNLVLYEQRELFKGRRIYLSDEVLVDYNDRSCVIKQCKVDKEIKAGVNLVKSYSWNYFHLMYEVIASLYYLENESIPKDIPLIIDEIITKIPQYSQLLNHFNFQNRQYITIQRGQTVKVNQLYQLPTVLIAPPNYRRIDTILKTDWQFDINSLLFLRENLLKINLKKSSPKKIFLARKKASSRRGYNEDEVFETLVNFGFEKVFVEDYTVQDQVALFNNANYIVGTTGAAFSNIIFCNRNCKILCFTNYNTPFGVFSSIAGYIGVDMIYLNDNNMALNLKSNLHEDFSVDTKLLIDILENKFFTPVAIYR